MESGPLAARRYGAMYLLLERRVGKSLSPSRRAQGVYCYNGRRDVSGPHTQMPSSRAPPAFATGNPKLTPEAPRNEDPSTGGYANW
jgi:hypothetical protein